MSLKDYTVTVNLNGWYVSGKEETNHVIYKRGQTFSGPLITKEMVNALVKKFTYKDVALGVSPVLTLKGGTPEELEKDFKASGGKGAAKAHLKQLRKLEKELSADNQKAAQKKRDEDKKAKKETKNAKIKNAEDEKAEFEKAEAEKMKSETASIGDKADKMVTESVKKEIDGDKKEKSSKKSKKKNK